MDNQTNYISEDLREALESAEGFTLHDVLNFIFRLKWILLVSLALFLGGAFLFYKMQVPLYETSGKVMFIDGNSGSVEVSVISDVTGQLKNGTLDDEILIIKSPSLMGSVVSRLGLNTRYYQYRLPLFHQSFPLFRSLLDVKEYEFYRDSPFSMDLLFNPYYSENSRPSYISVTFDAGREEGSYRLSKVVCGKESKEYSKEEGLHNFGDTLVFSGVNIVINSNGYMRQGDTFKAEYSSSDIAGEYFASGLSVSLESGIASSMTNMMVLSLVDTKPERSCDIINSLVKEYNFQSREFKSIAGVKSLEFIDDRLDEISGQLGNVEFNYMRYQKDNDYINGNITAITSGTSYEQQLIDLRLQRTYLDMVKEEMGKIGPDEYKPIPSGFGLSDNALNSVINEYNELIADRERLAVNSASNNPSVLKYNDKIKAARKNLVSNIESLDKVFNIRENELTGLKDDAKRERSIIPERQLGLAQISRKQQIIEPLYLQLSQRREEIQLSMFSITDNVRVIEPAKTNGSPLSPNKKRIFLFAILLALALPISFILLRNILRTKVETRDDIKKLLSQNVVATIPKSSQSVILPDKEAKRIDVEAFRMFRTNLQYLQGKMIQVTSSIPGEGKSFVASRIALSLSRLDKKVALVGLDLRKPALRKLFPKMNTHSGYSVVDYLRGKTDDFTKVGTQIMMNDRPTDIYFAGPVPPNPSELLCLDRMASLMDYLRANYDYVIFDSSPFLSVSDATIVNKYMDITLYVIRSDYTPLKMVGELDEIFRSGRLKNVNIVLNCMDMDAVKYRYGYGYGYGYYGYGKYGYGKYGYGYGYGYGSEEEKEMKK